MADSNRHNMFIVEETTYGTTPNNPALEVLRQTGTTLGLERDSFQSEELRADYQLADYRLGAHNNSGDINIEPSFDSHAMLLQGLLKSDDTFATGTVNEIEAGVTRRSFSIVRNFADITDKPYMLFDGVEVNSFTLSVPTSGMVTGVFNMMGQQSQVLANLTSLGIPTYPAQSETSVFDSFTGSLNEGGSALGIVSEISMTITNNLTARPVVGSFYPLRPAAGIMMASGSMTVYFESAALMEKFINETDSSLSLTLTDLDGNSYTFFLPKVKYTGGKPDVSGAGSILLTMPFQAVFDPTEGTSIRITRTPTV